MNTSPTGKSTPAERIFIATAKTTYSPGESVSGTLIFQTLEVKGPSDLFLKFYGIEVSCLVKGSNRNHLEEQKRTIFESKWCLLRWKSNLSAGLREVPFTFALPSEIPDSFHQEGLTFLAHITYKLEAWLQPLQPGPVLEEQKTLFEQRNLAIRKPITNISQAYTEEKLFPFTTWYCKTNGSLALRVHIEKNIYSIGEEVRTVLEIDNSSSKLENTEIVFQLIQELRFSGKSSKDYTMLIASAVKLGALPGSKPQSYPLAFVIPHFKGYMHHFDKRGSYQPKGGVDKSQNVLHSTTQGAFVSSEFFLQIHLKMKNYPEQSPKLKYPIKIRFPDARAKILGSSDYNHSQRLPKVDLGLASSSNIPKNIQEVEEKSNQQQMREIELVHKKSVPFGDSEVTASTLIGRQN